MSSDWSDTMLDIAVTFFYHPIYMIIDESIVEERLESDQGDQCDQSLSVVGWL